MIATLAAPSRLLHGSLDALTIAVPLCCSLLVVAATPTTEGDLQKIAVTFSAPPECGSEEQFQAEVAKRTRRLEFATEGAPVSVSISEPGATGAFKGRLEIGGAGQWQKRDLSGERCDKVVAGLALALVLALDPLAPAEPPTEPAPQPTPAEKTPETQAEIRDAASSSSTARGSDEPLRWGAAFVASGSPLPEPALGGGLTLELSGFFGFRASVDYLRAPPIDSPVLRTTFSAVTGRAAYCPSLLPVSPLGIDVCGGLSGGLLDVAATPQNGGSQIGRRRGVFSTELGMRIAVDVAALRLSLLGQGVLPFVRDNFVVGDPAGPDLKVFRAQRLGYLLGLGLSIPLSRGRSGDL